MSGEDFVDKAGPTGMLTEAASWWWRQIKSLLPGRASVLPPDAVVISVDQWVSAPLRVAGAILVRRAGVERMLAPFDLPGHTGAGLVLPAGPICLRLPPGSMLRRELRLPRAAGRDLRGALSFELDRLTPFDPPELIWGASAAHGAAGTFLEVALLLTSRAPVEALLQALAARQLFPAWLEAPEGRIALAKPAAGPVWRRLGWPGLCAVLALTCLAVPVIRQQLAFAALGRDIAACAPAAREALRLRGALGLAASGRAAIAAAQEGGDTLQVLAALTAALPDNTYLSNLTLQSGALTINGQSDTAAKLITVLAGTEMFRNPQFAAPVTRSISGTADLFSIRVAVAP